MAQPNHNDSDLPDDEIDATASAGPDASPDTSVEDDGFQDSINDLLAGLQINLEGLGTGPDGEDAAEAYAPNADVEPEAVSESPAAEGQTTAPEVTDLSGSEPRKEPASENAFGESSATEPTSELPENLPLDESAAVDGDDGASALPTADDILMRAGSVLNGGPPERSASKPEEPESEAGAQEAAETEADEVVAMPDSAALIGTAAEASDTSEPPTIGLQEVPEEGEVDEIVAMPDLNSMWSSGEASPKPAAAKEQRTPTLKGNIADRAGNLPPPPPAPIAIDDDDDEVPDDTPFEVPALVEADPEESEAEQSQNGATDPFAMSSLEGFNSNPDAVSPLDSMSVQPDEDLLSLEPEIESLEPLEADDFLEPSAVAGRKRSKLRLLFNVTSLAAGLALTGVGLVAGFYKTEIMEYVEDTDFDGSTLSRRITVVAKEVLEGLSHEGLYYMQSLDTEIKRVAPNEIRLHMAVAATLKQDLYLPVAESYAMRKFAFNPDAIEEAKAFADRSFPDQVNEPTRPWSGLYRLASMRGEIVPLRATFLLSRQDRESDWELSEARIRGEGDRSSWPEGEPLTAYPESHYNVESPEFEKAFKEYQKRSLAYVQRVEELRLTHTGEAARIAQTKDKNREQLVAALSQGSFFKGVAIDGEAGSDTREVYMVITETRKESSVLKGVFKFGPEQEISKHFTALVDFEDKSDGAVDGLLSITTVAFEGARAPEGVPQFFNPGTVSRISLRTDGYRLEGDSHAFSLRLVRTL